MNRRQFSFTLGWFGAMIAWAVRPVIGRRGPEAANRVPAGIDRFGDPLPPGVLTRFGTIRLWHSPGRLGVESLIFSPDGRLIATLGRDLPVVLWDAATGNEVRRLGVEPPGPQEAAGPIVRLVGPMAFSGDGATLAVGRSGGRVERWEVATGRPLPAWDGHRDDFVGLAFSPDSKTLVTGDSAGTILVRDADSGRVRHRLAGVDNDNEGPLNALALSGDGSLLATTAHEDPVILWDVGSGRRLRALEKSRFDRFGRLCLALSPDGATAAAGGHAYSITLWDARSGVVRAELTEGPDQELREGATWTTWTRAMPRSPRWRSRPDGRTCWPRRATTTRCASGTPRPAARSGGSTGRRGRPSRSPTPPTAGRWRRRGGTARSASGTSRPAGRRSARRPTAPPSPTSPSGPMASP